MTVWRALLPVVRPGPFALLAIRAALAPPTADVQTDTASIAGPRPT